MERTTFHKKARYLLKENQNLVQVKPETSEFQQDAKTLQKDREKFFAKKAAEEKTKQE